MQIEVHLHSFPSTAFLVCRLQICEGIEQLQPIAIRGWRLLQVCTPFRGRKPLWSKGQCFLAAARNLEASQLASENNAVMAQLFGCNESGNCFGSRGSGQTPGQKDQ